LYLSCATGGNQCIPYQKHKNSQIRGDNIKDINIVHSC
jgi:hypothetical protein